MYVIVTIVQGLRLYEGETIVNQAVLNFLEYNNLKYEASMFN